MQEKMEKTENILGDALAKDVAAIAEIRGISSDDIIREAVEARVRAVRDAVLHS
nr:hypothetical protein [Candidatus Sigynarchaeum springense]